MILVAGANVAHGHTKQVGGDGGVRDAGGGGSHEHLRVGVVLADELCQPLLNVRAHSRGGQGETVVAVYRAFDAACPCEGLFRAEVYGADGQEVSGDLFLQFSHGSFSSLLL